MKRILAVVALALVLVMALSSCGGARYAMGTGGTGGTYYAFTNAAAPMLGAKTGYTCTVLPSGGSDHHGRNKPHITLGKGQGNLAVPESAWEKIFAKYQDL